VPGNVGGHPIDRTTRGITDGFILFDRGYSVHSMRTTAAGIAAEIGCPTFRATEITAYLSNGGALEHGQEMAAHESARTTKLHDRARGGLRSTKWRGSGCKPDARLERKVEPICSNTFCTEKHLAVAIFIFWRTVLGSAPAPCHPEAITGGAENFGCGQPAGLLGASDCRKPDSAR